jgi:tyrosine-protein kinase Etk/Wzc
MNVTDDRPAFDLIPVLRRGWLRIAAVTFVAVLGTVVYALLATKWYEARMSILVMRPRGSLAGAIGAMLPIDIPDLSVGSGENEQIAAVLTSLSVSDSVIQKFDLVKRYKVEHMEEARRVLWGYCATNVNRKSGLVTLTCEDTDPNIAQAMVEHFGEVGNQVFNRVTKSSAREERQFLEVRVARARQEKEEAARKLRAFQEVNRVIDLPEQAKAVITAMASLRADLISKEIQLDYMKHYSSADEATVRQLSEQIGIMRAKLATLEVSTPTDGAAAARKGAAPGSNDPNIFPTAMSVPKLRFELESLYSDQKIADAVFFALTQRFEMAKVDEARETSTFQILDHPDVPTLKIRPKRRQIVVIGTLLGLLLGAAAAVGPTWWRWSMSHLTA